MYITNSTFLITGGGSGLGAATARQLAASGGSIVIADLHAEQGERLATEIGPHACFVACDVTDETSVEAAVNTAVQRFGGLHGVVNCAGVSVGERVLGRTGPHSLASFSRVIQVNLIGTFNVIRLAAHAMGDNEPTMGGERGVIINTSSIAAFEGQIGQAAYSASKGGVNAMTLPIARELAKFGIRVATIAPGLMDTPMMASMPDDLKLSLGQQVPFPPRLGNPQEYAALAQHIIENEMLNGCVIRLDGAIRMAPK